MTGFCSFSDPNCPDNRRYSPFAGEGLAGSCVLGEPPDAAMRVDALSQATGSWDGSSTPGCDGGVATWSWEGDTSNGWTVATNGCCGCVTCSANACASSASLTSASGLGVFNSGPAMGVVHQSDGLSAVYTGIPVTPGTTYRIELQLTELSAAIDCTLCSGILCTGSETTMGYFPNWTLQAKQTGSNLGSVGGTWASAQCRTCSSTPSDVGLKTLTITPSASRIDLTLSASLRSSQCCAAVNSVRVVVDSIRIFPLGC